MTRKLSLSEKIARKPASRACVFCHLKHLQCSNERPCKNCVKRNLGHECTDVVRKRAKYMKEMAMILSERSTSAEIKLEVPINQLKPTNNPKTNQNGPTSLDPTGSTADALAFLDEQNFIQRDIVAELKENRILDTTDDVLHRISSNKKLDALDVSDTPGSIDLFNLNYLNQEYLMLGDIILNLKPTSPTPSSLSEVPAFGTMPTITPESLHKLKYKDTRPFISLGFSTTSEKTGYPHALVEQGLNEIMGPVQPNMDPLAQQTAQTEPTGPKNAPQNDPKISTAASQDPLNPQRRPLQHPGYVNPLTTHQMYQKVQDIYNKNVIDFDYPLLYHNLTYFLKQRFLGNDLPSEQKQRKRENLLIILKLIASYRPTFIAAHKSLLKPYDFQFLEMSLQRVLLDCENLSQLNLSPTIIWRRTGEIVSFSEDLLSLLGYNLREVLSKRTFIMELMYDDDSIVNYFKQFKSVAVGNLHLTIFTKCKLQKKVSGDYIEFRSVWTVKRDLFDLPMLIVGQFLPILPAGDGVRMY